MTDYLVIGGGVIGMLTARELRRAGGAVTLIERGELGRESSWAGGGILSPLHPWRAPEPVTALADWGQRQYRALAQELLHETGVDPEWTLSGLLVLDSAEYAAARAWAGRVGARLELLEHQALHACAPALAADIESALWMPDIAQVRSPRLVRALRESLLLSGVVIREHTEVTDLLHQDRHMIGVDTPQDRIVAEQVVLAGGAWSEELLKRTGLHLPIAPVRGQMIVFKAVPGLLAHIIVKQERYLIPRRDGHILAGSTVEHCGFDRTTTLAAREELQAAALALVPALAQYPVAYQWAGLRPGSPTGVPFIGPHPELAGLYVNAGHFRNGLVLAPASARLLADLLLKRTPIIDPAPYLPVR